MTTTPASREQVLAVARDAYREGGHLTMEELAAAAGVSRATLYRLFPGKPALFAALMRDYSPFESIAATLASAGDRSPAEIIPPVGRAIASAMDGRVGLLLQLLYEASRATPDAGDGEGNAWEAAHAMSRSVPAIIGYLAGQMEAGRLRRMDPALAFQALAGPVLLHLVTRPLAGRPPTSMRRRWAPRPRPWLVFALPASRSRPDSS